MPPNLLGIHHITAIASRPQANVDFYAGVLGLRLVKQTVNFDDPGTYHLYYGDEQGYPGTVMTFFPWPNARQGQRGTGQVTVTAFAIPPDSIPYWLDRLEQHGLSYEAPVRRFDEEVLTCYDLDGLKLELVAHTGADDRHAWLDGPVPPQYAIRGFFGATMALEGYERTADLLAELMGFRLAAQHDNRFRYQLGPSRLDVLCMPTGQAGRVAAGTVHHIAWRTPDTLAQQAWREHLAGAGFNVTPVLDRQYFRSIYFREPGGVLFEIATDTPGFTEDEDHARLGTALQLPPWLEAQRPLIESQLPPLRVPH